MEIIAFWSANTKLHAANTKIPFQNRATLLAQALLRLIQSPPSGTLDPNQLETEIQIDIKIQINIKIEIEVDLEI